MAGDSGIVLKTAVLAEHDAREFLRAACPWRNRGSRNRIRALPRNRSPSKRAGSFPARSVTGGPTNATFSFGLTSFIISAIFTSTLKPGVEVNSTSSSKSDAIATVWSIEILCGGASTTLLSGIIPAG